jgi:VIT1/CCC1 family predicted Fe2+/Mn2+ transporter
MGTADGMTSILGVVLYLSSQPSLVFPAAAMGAVGAGVSMAASEWLSDSAHGLGASAVMGVATAGGSLVPAAPYAFSRGAMAQAASLVLCLALATGVGFLRSGPHSRRVLVLQTVGVLAAAFAAIGLCGLLTPGGAL